MGCHTWFWEKTEIDYEKAYNELYERVKHVPGKGTYVTKNGIHHHNLFRIHNYPVDKLFSLEETLKFIEDHKSEITYYHDSETKTFMELLEGFWKEFPDGMIDFG